MLIQAEYEVLMYSCNTSGQCILFKNNETVQLHYIAVYHTLHDSLKAKDSHKAPSLPDIATVSLHCD